jgi:hypothetical protein
MYTRRTKPMNDSDLKKALPNVKKFLLDCVYILESKDSDEEIPSLILFKIFLLWRNDCLPNFYITFVEFNDVVKQVLDFEPFKDSDGVAAWVGVGFTTLGFEYLPQAGFRGEVENE